MPVSKRISAHARPAPAGDCPRHQRRHRFGPERRPLGKAVGKDKVLGLLLPDKESSPESATFAAKHAAQLGIRTETVDITPALQGFGTYEKRDAVARSIFPEFGEGWKLKISLPGDLLNKDSFNVFMLTVVDPRGAEDGRAQWRAIPGHHRRHLHEATHANGDSVLLRGKTQLPCCGTTNKSEALQGLIRQVWRWRGGHRAHRPPLQEPGISAIPAPGRH